MPAPIIEGFSLSHAAILDGSTGAEVADIYGIREGTIEVDSDSYDNTGDDGVLSTWQWFNFATLTVQSGFLPLELASLLSGSTLNVSGDEPEGNAPDSQTYSMPLWNEASLNVAPRPVLIRVPSKTSGGQARVLDLVLYKVQFGPLSIDGPSYKDGLLVSYSGKAVMSDTNEVGDVLPDRSIGRIISRVPGTYTPGD